MKRSLIFFVIVICIYSKNSFSQVTDIDGNVYQTVTIGTQVWMKENLKTTKYSDGTAIPLITDNSSWAALTTPAYCWYNFDAATYKNTYGALYNWHAVNTGRLCPAGWHVPTDTEWTTLKDYLGGETIAGGKLKESGTSHWTTPNTDATNETGFTGLPGGYIAYSGVSGYLGSFGYWWTNTEKTATDVWYQYLSFDNGGASKLSGSKNYGFSVKCVKDNLSSGLVAYYPFNSNANDESGNGHNGVINGAILTSDRHGNSNKAYSFDGVSSYIQIPTDVLNNMTQGTVTAFIKLNQLNVQHSIIDKTQTYTANYFQLIVDNNNKARAAVNTTGTYGNNVLAADTWCQVSVTWDGFSLKYYLNGSPDGTYTSSGSIPDISRNIYIGKVDNGTAFFNGSIDDIRVYNRALSVSEISSLYHENGYADLTDIDGNIYNSVTIGTQVWMKENLKTTKLNDGTAIPNVTDNTAWAALTTPGYCWYNNDAATYKSTYGALYNWYTVNSGILCPAGWHVPSDSEWASLEAVLGGASVAGGKMKQTGTSLWLSPNTGATDESGLTMLPGGIRDYYGVFDYVNSYGEWWASDEDVNVNNFGAWRRLLNNLSSSTDRNGANKKYGFSVRCLKDAVGTGQPSITSFTPSSGPVGTSVTITGTGFSTTPANNFVWFGAAKATITAATSTQLTVTVPSGSTFQPISVTVNGLTAYSSNPFLPTFSSAQVITGTSFIAKTDFATSTSPIYVAVADFDTDGKPDIATVNQYSNSVSVFRNTSTSGIINSSSFSPRIDFTTGSAPVNIAASDIDGDGKQDIVVVNNISGTVSVFRNTSTSGSITSSSFSTKVDFPTSASPSGIAIADIDGDGKPDIVTSNMSSNNISVLRNTSVSGTIDGTSFAPKFDFSTGNNAVQVVISDIDGDSKPEVINTNYDGNSISILRNTSTSGEISSGTFSSKIEIPTGTGPYSLAAGDLDGDGKNDIAVANYNVNTISVFRNISTSGSITTSSLAVKNDYPANRCERVKIADLDGDAKPELVATDYTGSLVSILKNNCTTGSISFSAKVDLATGTMPQGLEICDFDGDNKPDIVVSNSSVASNSISVFKNIIASATKPSAPAVGAITQPTCTVSTGSVVLSGLPSTGTWTLTRLPDNVTFVSSGTSTTATGLSVGTYTYTVTNTSGLTSEASNEIIINVAPGTPASPTAGTIVQPTCNTPTGSIDIGSMPSSGTWTLTQIPGGTSTGTGTHAPVQGLAPGTYSFTVTNESGCTSLPLTGVVINAVPTGNTPVIELKWNSVLVCYNLNNVFTSWQWYKDNSPVASSPGRAFYNTNKAAGMYKVQTTDKDGCNNFSNIIQVTGGSKGVLLYPNPANDKVKISISDENTGDVVISLINSSGVKVLEDKFYKPGESLLREITVANLGYGIYTIKVAVNQKDISYNKLLISK